MLETERDIKRFWDIDSSDIQVLGMHGTMLFDTIAVARVYRTVFGIPATTARFYARIVRNTLLSSVVVNGGNHSFFSFNAFASPLGAPFADRIAMGDGMMAGYAAIGFGDVAPQAIFAHEFAHHIQFENGYFDDRSRRPTRPEQTRYTELMADAYSAYFLTHKRGLAMNKHRVAEFLERLLPDRRLRVHEQRPPRHAGPAHARRGVRLRRRRRAQKQGHILSSEAFHDAVPGGVPEPDRARRDLARAARNRTGAVPIRGGRARFICSTRQRRAPQAGWPAALMVAQGLEPWTSRM